MTFIRRAGTVVMTCAIVAAVNACGGSDGSAEPTVPPVPPIENAKDLRGADPCSLLTPEQLGQFGLAAPGTPGQTPEGLPRCEWRRASEANLTVTLFIAPDALGTLASNSDVTTARVRLEGYPALETFTDQGRFCQYDVGLAPDQVVMAAMTGGSPDSCTALQKVLPAVLSNLPPYQP